MMEDSRGQGDDAHHHDQSRADADQQLDHGGSSFVPHGHVPAGWPPRKMSRVVPVAPAEVRPTPVMVLLAVPAEFWAQTS